LARELARLTGESMTAAVTAAVRERLDRARRAEAVGLADRLLAIGKDCAARQKEPFRSADHGDPPYDECGIAAMIIDSSAADRDPSRRAGSVDCAGAIEAASHCRISAANFVESAIVIDGSRDPVASRRFDDLVKEVQLVIEPVTELKRGSRAKPTGISAEAAGTPPG
jgi:hypothetical protein